MLIRSNCVKSTKNENWNCPKKEVLVYKPEEIANILKISKSQVYTLCREGVLPAFYIGRNLRIPNKDFKTWLDEQYSGFSDYED